MQSSGGWLFYGHFTVLWPFGGVSNDGHFDCICIVKLE